MIISSKAPSLILKYSAAAAGAFYLSMPAAAHAACMSRPLEAVAQVPDEDKGQLFRVVVADEDVPDFLAKGFQISDCRALLFAEDSPPRYRDEICRRAAIKDDGVQEQFRRGLGVNPRALCETAEKLLGPRQSGD